MSDRPPITVAIVPHTHWDREWYDTFQTFRLRLVKLLDTLLPMLESDPSYARFMLDGQTVVVDDYLEVRPHARAALQRLAAAGRLSVGPWMVLMDEFMVSGETMVRDLQFGLARGSELGGAMQIGYLPDMFGHVAQMPQLIRLAGMEHAVAWRGVPAAVEQTAFWWQAPDGSRVRTEYLYGSYSNGRDLPQDAKRLVLRAADYEQELGPARLDSMLLMNGTDHQMPQPWLGRVVAEANAIQDDYEFVVTSLAEYLPTQPSDALVTDRGRAAFGRAGQPVDGRRVEPCRRAPRVRGGRTRARTARRTARARCSCLPTATRTRSPTSRGATSFATARTTRRARAASTRSSTRYSSATTKRARSATGSRAMPCTRSPPASTRAPGATVVGEPDRAPPHRTRRGDAAGDRPGAHGRRERHAAPDAVRRRDQRRGLRHDGHRPEGAVGARPHARHGVRGPHDLVVRSHDPRRRARDRAAGGRARAIRIATSTELREQILDLGDTRRDREPPPVRDAAAARAVRHRRQSPGSAGRASRPSTATHRAAR